MGIKIGNTDINAIKIGSTQRLPAEYQEVEYIESSGTQCIDTGLTVSGNVKIDFEYMPLESSATSPIFMDDGWRVNGFGSGNTYLYYGGYTSNNEGVSVGSLVQNVKAHDIIAKDGSSRNEGITWIPSSSYPSPTGNLKIFVGQRAGNITSYTQTRLYSYKRYDNDILTQDLVPCYRRNDTEIGLYDLVNDIFYINVGTGTFTKGADVGELYKNIQKVYLGSTLIRPSEIWHPTENTLLYLPLENDFVDRSGQATTRVFTTSGLSYTTVGGVPSVHIGTTGGGKLTTPYPLVSKTSTDPCTVSCLVYVTSQQTSARRTVVEFAATDGNRIFFVLEGNTKQIRFAIDYNGTGKEVSPRGDIIANSWMHLVLVSTTSSIKGYVNGVLAGEISPGWANPRGYWQNSWDNSQGIFCKRDVGNYGNGLNGNARELIMENKEWTADYVAKYYTRIKGKLGIN